MQESWQQQLKLSLERPYKDDNGEPIPVLFNITPEGEHVYEPQIDPSEALGPRLTRILEERGKDFFESKVSQLSKEKAIQEEDGDPRREAAGSEATESESPHIMTSAELFKMRSEIIPQLHVALGEMTHARELLNLLLSSSVAPPIQSQQNPTLTATIVTKPPPISSVQAFNAQLVIAGKDEALRKAANLFKTAADNMERGRVKADRYWIDALKIRRKNYGLVPAPLPFGSAMGKGADKTSKDFVVSFGLEESPSIFRRRAIAHMSTLEIGADSLLFPHRQRTRLWVSLRTEGEPISHSSISSPDDESLENCLSTAQVEIIEQEIFSNLVNEAPNQQKAAARVSERLIVIDAAQNIELTFELVDSAAGQSMPPEGPASWKCDLIYSALHILLLRSHAHLKQQRLGAGAVRAQSIKPTPPPPILRPIIDCIQYEVFCKRIKSEFERALKALQDARICASLRFEPVGEIGEQLSQIIGEKHDGRITGEAVLRVDKRHSLRITFSSPSTLTAHLPQATLPISSIPQFRQLLSSEVERCLLQGICETGRALCEKVKGIWFIDEVERRSIGRWEGGVLNFRVKCTDNFAVRSSVFRLILSSGQAATMGDTFTPQNGVSLFEWAQGIIRSALEL